MGENNKVILYQGAPLEKIAASEIVLVSKDKPLMEQQRMFLASDIVVGEYGVAGFVLVDNQPEDRWLSYDDGSKTGVPWCDTDSLHFVIWKDKEPHRLSHYIDTSQGFKMIRYFVLPSNIKEFFKTDKYLGEPVIDKCVCDGTLPEDFDEEKVNPFYAFREGKERELINKIVSHINPRFEQIGELRFSWEDFGHHVYFSFHPWQVYKPVLEAGEESVIRAVRNFDECLSRFDNRKKLQKKILEVEQAQEYMGVLPPEETPSD